MGWNVCAFLIVSPFCSHMSSGLYPSSLFAVVSTDCLFPLAVIWLCSPDTRRVAAIRGRQYHQYNAQCRDLLHVWHLIYLKHLLRVVNYQTESCVGELGGVLYSRELKGLTLTSGPRTSNKFRPAAQIGLVFPLKTPHPSAEFLLIWVSAWLPEAPLFTDACGVTLILAVTPIHI